MVPTSWAGGITHLEPLEPPPSSNMEPCGSHASDINDLGQVVGQAQVGCYEPWHYGLFPVLWENRVPTKLSQSGGYASAINNRSQVVWVYWYSDAYLWDHGASVLLASDATPFDINDAGQVVGSRGNTAFLWANGTLKGLRTLGGNNSNATGINEAGQIVGDSATATGRTHAFLWVNNSLGDMGGTMHDLNDLIPADSGWELLSAAAINNRGEIVGSGIHDGQRHAFLLRPGG
jgi:probable HAF family extracellular repeat protein